MAAPIEPAGSADEARPEAQSGYEPGRGPFAWSRVAGPNSGAAKDAPWPRLARMDDQPPREASPAAPGGLRSGRSQMFVWIAAQVGGLGLLLGGYLLGQAWAPRAAIPASVPKMTPSAGSSSPILHVATARTLEAVNQALRAERRHDFAGARAIYGEVSNDESVVPGVEYRLALLALHEGDVAQADVHLDRSIRAGDALAACYLFGASLAGMNNDYAEAAARLAAAVRAEPFNAKLVFCWGEALRRAGHFPEAIQHLSEALDRPDTAAARELYLFKLRLAKVEAGEGEGVDAELTKPTPAAGWLVLAAARDLLGNNERAAAAHLDQARRGLPPEAFATYLQDYLFQSRRTRPGLSAILNVAPPTAAVPADAPLQDPAAWTPAEADPAAWPPFPKVP